MKTCLVLEIKNNKAIVLLSGGQIMETRASKDWQVGQTVTVDTRKTKIRYGFVAVACLLLVFAVVAPVASFMTESDDTVSDLSGDIREYAEPAVVAAELKDLDKNYENIYDIVNNSWTITSETPLVESAEPSVSPESDSSSSANKEAQSQENESMYDIGSGGGSDQIEYSDTNIQVDGIQEADVIKTDGKLIYAANSKNLVILRANDGDPKVLSKIKQDGDKGQFFEMYIEDDVLILLSNTAKTTKDGEDRIMTTVNIYDVSDPENPEKINTLSQSGEYVDSRMAGNHLYMISSHEIKLSYLKKDEPDTYIPEINNGNETKVVPAKDIAICPVETYPTYTVVGSIDVGAPDDFVDTESILGGASDVYASKTNVYITTWADDVEQKNGSEIELSKTQVVKVGFDKGKLNKPKSAIVPGMVMDQFCMDEKDGNLRMVNNVYWYANDKGEYSEGSYTALFVLDENLKEIGKIKDLAPGEDLYSCRFMGDYAYFVTFENVDPLFTADLSDPKNPKVIGKLKIPGFSDYLHPYSDGLLLGIGNDANETTGNVGNLKLSMFDNSDPSDVKEKHKTIVQGYDFTEVSENHKAILVDSKKKLIAFPSENTYLVYTYDDKSGFAKVGEMKYDGVDDYEYFENAIRGLYINDDFYVISPNTVRTFHMKKGFKSKSTLKINNDAEPVNKNNIYYSYWDDGTEID